MLRTPRSIPGLHLLASAAALCAAAAALPAERFTESAPAPGGELKLLPAGHAGFDTITEAVATEYRALMELVRQALRAKLRLQPDASSYYIDVQGMYPDHVVVSIDGRLWRYPYSMNADNTVTIGERTEVVVAYTAVKESASAAGSTALATFVEAKDGSIEVTIIRAGLSLNGNFYPDTVLQAAAPLFEGVRVFVKTDDEHTKGAGKAVNNLIGGIYGVRFVPGVGADKGHLTGTFRPIDPADAVVKKMTEAVRRGMQNLMGLSIDAMAHTKRERRGGKDVRVAAKFAQVNSVDLIVEPGAGGGLDRLAEAAAETHPNTPTEGGETTMPLWKKRLLEALAVLNATRAQALTSQATEATDEQVTQALREACAERKLEPEAVIAAAIAAIDEAGVKASLGRITEAAAKAASKGSGGEGDDTVMVTRGELALREARLYATSALAASNLPAAAKEKLGAELRARERLTEVDVDQAIKAERAYLAVMSESGRPAGMPQITVEDRGIMVADMLDAFFDPSHKNHKLVPSFKECYIAITGDRRVTGRWDDCNHGLMRESLGRFAEAVNTSTFALALGDSITRRLMAAYAGDTDYAAWRRVCTTTPVMDFRSQRRTRIGGYGNLPIVAQSAGYTALASPGDLEATYAVAKRGGLETVTLEAIKNDDVQAIRRVPTEMALSANITLYEFVFDIYRTNPTIYDSAALYTVGRGNLFTAALDASTFAAHRLAMIKQTRLGSAKRRQVAPERIIVPPDLQETAYNLFVRGQNNDKTFVQTINPEVIVVPYWTDVNDWVTLADPAKMPVLEIGFLDGREEPEVFVQDAPNVGSLFSNDQITYKIRHIYGGAVVPEGDKATTKAVVP